MLYCSCILDAEKASDIRTTPTTASPIVNITKVNQDLQNKKLKSQTDKTAPTPKAKRVINLYQSDNSNNEESASDSNYEDSENEHVDIMIESKSDKEDAEQVTANVKMGRVSETKSPAVSTEDAETIKISAGSDEEESELEEEEDGDETMMEAANESRVEKVVKEPVTENRQSKDTEKVALSQELFASKYKSYYNVIVTVHALFTYMYMYIIMHIHVHNYVDFMLLFFLR